MKNKIILYLSVAFSLYVFFYFFKNDGLVKYSWLTQSHIDESAIVLKPVLPALEDYFNNNGEVLPKNMSEIGFSHLNNISDNKFVDKIVIKNRTVFVQIKDQNSDNRVSFSLRPKLVIQPFGLRWECNIGSISPKFFESSFPDCVPPKVTPFSKMMEMVAFNIPSEVKKAVSHGADVNHILDGQSALYLAIDNKSLGMVKLLISLGANVNLKNTADFGRTPLMYGVMKKNMNIIEILVRNGADVNAVDSEGDNVLTYIEQENRDLEDYLVDNGAEVDF